MLRCAQHDRGGSAGQGCLVTPFTSFRASSERSEGSGLMGGEMLRCAQHDRMGSAGQGGFRVHVGASEKGV